MTTVSAGSRFQAWASLFIFSVVCILAHATSISVVDAAVNWVTAALSISLIFSFFAVLAHFFVKDKFVGQLPEGGVALLLLIFWCACLPTIMSPSRNIAVRGVVITNSNLYFFSWISFACVVYIVADFAQEISGRQFNTVVSQKNTKWCSLFAVSIVVLAASSMIHQDLGCTGKGWNVCQRTNYAISLGVFGMVFSATAFALVATQKMNLMMESVISGVIFVMYVFGVGFITFSDGPATTVGNLYFSTWLGFGISLFLLIESMEEMNATRSIGGGGKMNSAPAPALAQVEQQEGPNDDVEISLGQ